MMWPNGIWRNPMPAATDGIESPIRRSDQDSLFNVRVPGRIIIALI